MCKAPISKLSHSQVLGLGGDLVQSTELARICFNPGVCEPRPSVCPRTGAFSYKSQDASPMRHFASALCIRVLSLSCVCSCFYLSICGCHTIWDSLARISCYLPFMVSSAVRGRNGSLSPDSQCGMQPLCGPQTAESGAGVSPPLWTLFPSPTRPFVTSSLVECAWVSRQHVLKPSACVEKLMWAQ